MNYGIVIRMLGNLLMIESACMILPFLVSLIYRQSDIVAFAFSIVATCLVGFAMSKFRNPGNFIRIREGVAIVAIGWILISVFGSLPFMISGSIPSFVDAFFETVSGFTTTGSTIIDDIEMLPYGILFWRSFTQWLGGMGILVFTVSILPAFGVGGFQVFKAESPGPVPDKIVPRIKDTAKILYKIYLVITVVEIILLMLGGMTLFDAAVHTFGTVGTGGLSVKNASIGAYDSTYIDMVIAIFMTISGVNFSLYYILLKGRWKEILRDQELRFYLGVIIVSFLLITLDLSLNFYHSLWKSARYSVFQVSSIITTTGYTITNFDLWPTFSKFILFMLMFVGGCAGSTGGSIKNIRILVLFKMVKREILKIFHPRAVIPIKIGDKPLPSEVLSGISSFFFLYIIIFVVGTLIVSLEKVSLVSASSAVAATLGNIGPGFEVIGPSHTFSHFSPPIKLLLSGFMLMGRLELFTFIALFTRNFWKSDI